MSGSSGTAHGRSPIDPGLFVFPGRANFLLVRIDRPATDAAALAGRLLSDGSPFGRATTSAGWMAVFPGCRPHGRK
jgi:hypothetical protein